MKNGVVRNILFVTIPTLLVLLILAEGIVRILLPDIDLYELTGQKQIANPMSKWAVNDPYAAYTAIPGVYSEGKTVNSHGFISTPEIDLIKEEGTTRIIFLGGSSTAGTGVDLEDADTWPWKTVEMLRAETNKKIDFINAALGGYSTFESYGRLWSRLRFFQPDIVVVYHGWNEMYYFTEMAEDPVSWKKNFQVDGTMSVAWIPPSRVDPYIAWSKLLTRVRLLLTKKKTIDGELPAANQPAPTLKNEFNKKGLDIYRQNLRLIRDFCVNNHITFFICKQATLIAENTSESDLWRCRYDYHGFDHQAHLEAFRAIYKVIDEEIPERNIIDVTVLSGVGDYFYDHVHPTGLGTGMIAEIVSRHLADHYFKSKD